MKGPGFRRDLDIRRLWRCPACGRERRLSGDHTSLRCHCQPDGVWMNIKAERNGVPRPSLPMTTPEIPVSDFHLTEEELAKTLEGRIRHRGPTRPAPEENDANRRPPRQGDRPPTGQDGSPRPPQAQDRGQPEPSTAEAGPPREKNRKERKRPNDQRRQPGNVPAADSTPPADESLPRENPAPMPPEVDEPFAEGLE